MDMQKHAAPTTVGGALATIFMMYGDQLSLVPLDLSTEQSGMLWGALTVVFTTVVNVVKPYVLRGDRSLDAPAVLEPEEIVLTKEVKD